MGSEQGMNETNPDFDNSMSTQTNKFVSEQFKAVSTMGSEQGRDETALKFDISPTIEQDNLSSNQDQDGLLVPILVTSSVCLLVCVFLCIFFIFLKKKINKNIKLESESAA